MNNPNTVSEKEIKPTKFYANKNRSTDFEDLRTFTSKKVTLSPEDYSKYIFVINYQYRNDKKDNNEEVEVDSLKSVVKGYEKGQTMPNISRDILELIKVPDSQHRVELQNGTIVSGELLQESDSTLTLRTQIGTLVLKKEIRKF